MEFIRFNHSYFKILVLILMLHLGCQEQGPVKDPVKEEENLAPYDFDVTIDHIGSNEATLNWGPVYDPDSDELFHLVYLRDQLIYTSTIDGLIKLDNLKPETTYEGKVVVTDSINEALSKFFSFKTLRYTSKFSKLYLGEDGNGPNVDAIAETDDGGYMLSGTIDRNGDPGLLVMKIDSLGYKEWTKSYPSNGYYYDAQIFKFKDSFLIIRGKSITKIDHQGALRWQHFSTSDFVTEYHSLVVTDNDLLVVGSGHDQANLGIITKMQFNGGVVWERSFSLDQSTRALSITKTNDGHFMILGSIYSDNHTSIPYLAKVSVDGDFIWTKPYSIGIYYNFPKEVKLSQDGGFIVAGFVLDHISLKYGRVFKVDAEGTIEWDHLYSNYDTQFDAIDQTEDGGYILCGYEGDRSERGILVKLSSNGSIEWWQKYLPNYSDYIWRLFDVQQTKDRGFILVGLKGAVWTFKDKEMGAWVMKTDGSGNYN